MIDAKFRKDLIGIVSDPHIGVHKNSDDFYEIADNWADWVISTLKPKGIETLFILGDWHHHRESILVKTLDFSVNILNKLRSEFHVCILTGNHDCYFKDNSDIHSLKQFTPWDNVTIFDRYTHITIGEKSKNTLSIVPWGHDINDVKKSDVIFGHFEINNFRWNKHSICDNGVDSKNFLNKGKLIFSGHFHMRDVKKYKNGEIIYVGSAYQQDFNDVGNTHGLYILDCDTLEYEFIENTISPKFVYIYTSDFSKSKISKDVIQGNYIKLKINEDINESELESIMADIRAFNPAHLSSDSLDSNTLIDTSDFELTVDKLNLKSSIEEFVKKMESEYESLILDKLGAYYDEAMDGRL